MKEVSHRWFKCSCGYENDRDVIAVVNLNGRGVSDPLDCPSNERCKPEPMRGTLDPSRIGRKSVCILQVTFLITYLNGIIIILSENLFCLIFIQ